MPENRAGADARDNLERDRPHPGKGEADETSRGRLGELGEASPLPAMLPGSPQEETDLSIRVMDLVWKRFPGSGSELLVLLACADWGNDQGGRVYPSIAGLATKVRVSESQARRVLHGLIRDGWVHVVANAYGGKPGTTRQYQIDLGKLRAQPALDITTSADATPADDTPRMDAQDGSHGCEGGVAPVRETAGAHDTRTVKEPSREPLEEPHVPPAAPSVPALPEHDHLDDARLIWNEICGPVLGGVLRLSDTRRNLIRARIAEMPGAGAWSAYCRRIAASDFLAGRVSGRSWRATFDWCLKASNALKIQEGAYDNRRDDGRTAQDRRAWAMDEMANMRKPTGPIDPFEDGRPIIEGDWQP
jgi:hypothetical protein